NDPETEHRREISALGYSATGKFSGFMADVKALLLEKHSGKAHGAADAAEPDDGKLKRLNPEIKRVSEQEDKAQAEKDKYTVETSLEAYTLKKRDEVAQGLDELLAKAEASKAA